MSDTKNVDKRLEESLEELANDGPAIIKLKEDLTRILADFVLKKQEQRISEGKEPSMNLDILASVLIGTLVSLVGNTSTFSGGKLYTMVYGAFSTAMMASLELLQEPEDQNADQEPNQQEEKIPTGTTIH